MHDVWASWGRQVSINTDSPTDDQTSSPSQIAVELSELGPNYVRFVLQSLAFAHIREYLIRFCGKTHQKIRCVCSSCPSRRWFAQPVEHVGAARRYDGCSCRRTGRCGRPSRLGKIVAAAEHYERGKRSVTVSEPRPTTIFPARMGVISSGTRLSLRRIV